MVFVGEIVAYGGSTIPSNFLICDGSAVSRTTYAGLFAVIGTTYGVGDNSTTFNLPNLKDSLIFGYTSSDTGFDSIGETGGNNAIDISHIHTQTAHTHAVSGSLPASGSTAWLDNGSNVFYGAVSGHTHTFSGSSGAMTDAGTNSQLSATQSTLNPYIALKFMIRYTIIRNPNFIFNLL